MVFFFYVVFVLFAPPRVASPWMPFWRPPEGPRANLSNFGRGRRLGRSPLKASALVRRGLWPGPRAARGPDLMAAANAADPEQFSQIQAESNFGHPLKDFF